MKITRIWLSSVVACLFAALCTSCATCDAGKGTPTPVQPDGKDRPQLKSSAPMPRKGTPTPIVDPNGK